MSTSDTMKIKPVPKSLAHSVQTALKTQERMHAAAAAREASEAAEKQRRRDAQAAQAVEAHLNEMADNAAMDLARRDAQHRGRQHNHGQKPQSQQPRQQPQSRPVVPMAAVRLGRMAELAWKLLTPLERIEGLPLWRLAALANLHFIPIPDTTLDHLAGTLMCFRLVNPVGALANRRYGVVFLRRPMPGADQAIEGIKLLDHQGNILAAVGQVPVAEHEQCSRFTVGIFDGPDRVPEGWSYNTKDGKPSKELTNFIVACLPRRREL